jgi:hypothetical protein
MRALSGSDVLDLWERGSRLQSLDRGLMVLGAALPETPHESLADWPLGRRNVALAELHCAVFGPSLQGWISCPQCAEKLEFQMDGSALMGQPGPPPNEKVVVRGHSFHLPTSRDLARAATETDSRLAALRLLESCLDAGESPVWDAGESPVWSDEDLEEVGDKMASADAMAETLLKFHCPKCHSDWDDTLDIVAFLWGEIEARAKRLFREIHTLASVYGWTESEILSLSEPRRSTYLEMVQR